MKFRNCVNCGKYKYIEGNGLCRGCYNKNTPSYSFSYDSAYERLSSGNSRSIRNSSDGHQLVVGGKRSGRSLANKVELYDAVKNSNSAVYIIDQNEDYKKMMDELGGEYLTMSTYDCMNLLHVERANSNQVSLSTRIRRIIDIIRRCYSIAGLFMNKIREKVLVTVIKEAYSRNGIKLQPSTHSNKSPTISDIISMLDDMRSNPSNFPKFKSYNNKKKVRRTLKYLHLELRDIDNRVGLRDNLNRSFSKDLMCFNISSIKSVNIRGVKIQMILNEILENAKTNNKKNLLYIDDGESLFSTSSSSLGSMEAIFKQARFENLGISLSVKDDHSLITSDTFRKVSDKIQYRRVHRLNNTTDGIQKTLQIPDKKYSKLPKLKTGSNNESEVLFSESSSSRYSKELIETEDSLLSKID